MTKLHKNSGAAILARIPAREWRGLVPEWQGGRLRIPLECAKCGETDHWSATRVIGPQTAIPKIIQLGWRVDGKIICPICVTPHKKPQHKLVEVVMNNVTKLDTPKLLDDQKKNKRFVIIALEDYFDESVSRYREGKSDKTVADELDLSEAFVATVREEFYGKIAEPEDVAQFRIDIAGMQKGLDTLKSKFESMCKRNGWRV